MHYTKWLKNDCGSWGVFMRTLVFSSLFSVLLLVGYQWNSDPESVRQTLDSADQALPALPDVRGLVETVRQTTFQTPEKNIVDGSLRVTSKQYQKSSKVKERRTLTQGASHEAAQDESLSVVNTLSADLAKPQGNDKPNSADGRWIESLSGAQLSVQASIKNRPKTCNANTECVSESHATGISVVGVVVDTKKMGARSPQLVDGMIGLGDAIDTPAIYLH